MLTVFDAKDCGGWSPRIANVRTRSKKLLVVPIPVLRNCGRCQREAREMESHPGATVLYVLSEGRALVWIFRPRIQEQYDLILRQDFAPELTPIRGGTIIKTPFPRLGGKPSIRLANEADVRLVVLTGVKR